MFRNFSNRLQRLTITAVAACALSALGPKVALADWLKAESRHFVVYSNGFERDLREMVTELENFDYVLRLFMGVDVNAETFRKLPVYITNPTGLRTVRPGINANVAGYYVASSEDIFAVATRNDSFRTLKHEYAHHFMQQEFNYPYPGWFVEGFAEYCAPAEFTRASVFVGKPDRMRAESLGSGPIDVMCVI